MSMLYKDNLIFVKIKIQHHVCVKQAIMTDKKSNLISLCIPRSGEKWNIYDMSKKCLYFGYSAKNFEKHNSNVRHGSKHDFHT